MKKTFVVLALIALSLNVDAEGPKVTVRHNGHIIQISQSALQNHLGHGDDIMVLYLGNWITIAEYNVIMGNNDGGVII